LVVSGELFASLSAPMTDEVRRRAERCWRERGLALIDPGKIKNPVQRRFVEDAIVAQLGPRNAGG
jgi:hypothetical protein